QLICAWIVAADNACQLPGSNNEHGRRSIPHECPEYERVVLTHADPQAPTDVLLEIVRRRPVGLAVPGADSSRGLHRAALTAVAAISTGSSRHAPIADIDGCSARCAQ